jgi:hypothetical protein
MYFGGLDLSSLDRVVNQTGHLYPLASDTVAAMDSHWKLKSNSLAQALRFFIALIVLPHWENFVSA